MRTVPLHASEHVCACVLVHLFCAHVCAHTWLHLPVLMHVLAQASVSGLASRLLAIMSSTVVVRGIPAIAGDPRASSPRCIADRRVTQPKWQQLLDSQSILGESRRRN